MHYHKHLLSLNSVCPGDHTLEEYPKDIIATDPGLCFGHVNKAEVMYQFKTASDSSQTKPKAIIKSCFSDGIIEEMK